jgi:hypothetical protein
MQRPNIVRMLRASLNVAAQAQIIATDSLGLVVVTLFRQESRKCMPGRVHPSPRFNVLEVIVSSNALSQVGVTQFVIAPMIFKFTIQHSFGDRQYVMSRIVEKSSLRRDAAEAFMETSALFFRRPKILERGVSYAFGVVVHRRGGQIQFRGVRPRLVDNILPASESVRLLIRKP